MSVNPTEGLTHDQIMEACRNLGIDLESCSACAELFYTGRTTSPSHSPNCRLHCHADGNHTNGDALSALSPPAYGYEFGRSVAQWQRSNLNSNHLLDLAGEAGGDSCGSNATIEILCGALDEMTRLYIHEMQHASIMINKLKAELAAERASKTSSANSSITWNTNLDEAPFNEWFVVWVSDTSNYNAESWTHAIKIKDLVPSGYTLRYGNLMVSKPELLMHAWISGPIFYEQVLHIIR